MRELVRGFALALVLGVGFLVSVGGAEASACDLLPKYRAMHGNIESVAGATLVLAPRSGDAVAFAKAGNVKVMGAKTSWGDLAAGDRAIVGWLISDSPAVAYEICVLGDS